MIYSLQQNAYDLVLHHWQVNTEPSMRDNMRRMHEHMARVVQGEVDTIANKGIVITEEMVETIRLQVWADFNQD